MKKIYTSIAILIFGVGAIAQNNSKTSSSHLSNTFLSDPQVVSFKQHNTVTTQAVGDTVFVFDGKYIYDWNSTLPATFNIQLEDIDTLTLNSAMTGAGWPTKASFLRTYDTIKNNNLCYKHPDTVFALIATSWFKTAGQANDWFELGPIHVPAAGGTLRWRDNNWDKTYRDGYKILVNTTGLGSTNFTNAPIFTAADNDPLIAGDTVNTPHSVYVQHSASLGSIAGQDIYVAVNHYALDQFVLAITDIQLIEGSTAGVQENNSVIAALQNMPNPANDNTTITYSLKESANVELSLFDVTGKKLIELNRGMQTVGSHQVKLDVSALASGIYFYTISAGTNKMTSKISVVK